MISATNDTPAIAQMRRLASSPLMFAALLCMSGGLSYLFFVEAAALFTPHAIPSTPDAVQLLHLVRDGMLLVEVVLLLMLLGGLWAISLAARRNPAWRPVRSFGWIHGVLLGEFVYEMLVLALELAANLVDAVLFPERAAMHLTFTACLIGVGVITVVLHHQVIGALNAGRETLRSGVPYTRHLSVWGGVLIFAVSLIAIPEPSAWLTALGEVLLGVLLLKHRRCMKQLTE